MSHDTPKPDHAYLQGTDPELLAHSLLTILLKNTSLEAAALRDSLVARTFHVSRRGDHLD